MPDEPRPYVSGFCSVGHHEGGRYPGPSGKLNKTCSMIEDCKCPEPNCHTFYDEMYRTAELPRQVVDNSGYIPEQIDASLLPKPTVVEAPPVSSSRPVATDPGTLESVAPGTLPPVQRRTYPPTQSGRFARGQLEHLVNLTCIGWVADGEEGICSPSYISREIGRAEGVEPPSVGAIDAVLKRWVEMGYATTGQSPTRFLAFTPEGIEVGVEYLKEKIKRGIR